MYPDPDNAPDELKNIKGPCGPISVWMVLERNKISVPAQDIIESTQYREEFGCFAVCMAFALQEFGFDVIFQTDEDSNINPIELQAYKKVRIAKAASVSKLAKYVDTGRDVIVSYDEFGSEGHFSPFSGINENKVILPYSRRGIMLLSEFTRRRRADQICRQSIIASVAT